MIPHTLNSFTWRGWIDEPIGWLSCFKEVDLIFSRRSISVDLHSASRARRPTFAACTIRARNISIRQIHARGNSVGFFKTWNDMRGVRAAAQRLFAPVDECYFRRISHARSGTSSRRSSLATPRKGEREGLSREWPDVSPARLCLTPRIFPLNFPDARIYHRAVSPPGKTRTLHSREAIPITIAPEIPHIELRTYTITFRQDLSGSANETAGVF